MSQSFRSTEAGVAIQPDMALDCGVVVARCEVVLRDSSHYPLRRLKCDFHEGVLSLHGIVPSYYLRQLAQALLPNLENVKEINNKVVVQRRNARFEHW